MRLHPSDLSVWTTGTWVNDGNVGSINGFCQDTRKLRSGQCFLAIRTLKDDGHRYLKEASDRGASAALVEKIDADVPLPQLQVSDVPKAFQTIARRVRRQLTLPVVAVTGSYGKTTVKDLLACLLGHAVTAKSPGNFNNGLGLPLSMAQTDPVLHRYAVWELAVSRPGEMEVLGGMAQPDWGIVLNVAPAHTAFFEGSVEAVAEEKSVLLRHVRPSGTCLFPFSLLRYPCFASHVSRAFVLCRPSEAASVDLARTLIYETQRSDQGRWKLSLQGNGFRHTFDIPFLLTEGFLSTFAVALFVALWMGVPASVLEDRLATWKPSLHRGEWRTVGSRRFFVDCYNANPVSMLESVRTFQMQAPSRWP
ncbi:MAG: hypothetical protein LBR62_02215, partial [Puniceicoccales bacterium]|nr:hypothetical protein [Puniceicoccales bacterium]